jgi:hypothetical protein
MYENISGVCGVGWNERAGSYEGVMYSHIQGAKIKICSQIFRDFSLLMLIRSHFLQKINNIRR